MKTSTNTACHRNAKVALNFRLAACSPESTILSTETRIKSFGSAALWKFRLYWSLRRNQPLKSFLRSPSTRTTALIRLEVPSHQGQLNLILKPPSFPPRIPHHTPPPPFFH